MAPNDDLLFRYALRFVGLPYIWGGSSPLVGFDCSGLVLELLEACGKWSRVLGDASASGIHAYFLKMGRAPQATPAFGALAFYGASLQTISHIAFCLSDTLIVEAGGGDHTTVTPEAARKRNACVRVRPIKHRGDLVDVLMS